MTHCKGNNAIGQMMEAIIENGGTIERSGVACLS